MDSKDIKLEEVTKRKSRESNTPERVSGEGQEEDEDEFDFGEAVYDEEKYGGL